MTQRIERLLTPDDRAATPYLSIPFEVPAGTSSVEVRLEFDRSAGVIDLGCEGPDGWRGWSGGARQRFVITADAATWGYTPGPLEPGEWRVVLGLYRVGAPGVRIAIDIDVPAVGGIDPDPPAPAPERPLSGAAARSIPRSDGLTWWACDFHSHTLHSDGKFSIEQLAAKAATNGVDALAITDHNTVSAHRHLPAAAERYGLSLIPGQEITTDRGHANAFGPLPFIDFRRHPDEWVAAVAAHGGLLSINHPISGDCSWQWDLAERPRLAEVMHSTWLLDLGATAIWSWINAWGVDDLVLLGGSDFHHGETGNRVGCPTTWVAAADPSPATILDAVAAGRTALSMGTPTEGALLVRDGDDLWAIGADGALHADWEGRQQLVRGDAVRIANARGGIHRLVTVDGHILAMSK